MLEQQAGTSSVASVKGGTQSSNILVHTRQQNNPVLGYIKKVRAFLPGNSLNDISMYAHSKHLKRSETFDPCNISFSYSFLPGGI